jgi:hypothetical protein
MANDLMRAVLALHVSSLGMYAMISMTLTMKISNDGTLTINDHALIAIGILNDTYPHQKMTLKSSQEVL